jgi:hypothetical protein
MTASELLRGLKPGDMVSVESVVAADEAIALFTALPATGDDSPRSRGFLCGGLIQAAFAELLGPDVIPVCSSQSFKVAASPFAGDRVSVNVEVTAVDAEGGLFAYRALGTRERQEVFSSQGTVHPQRRPS